MEQSQIPDYVKEAIETFRHLMVKRKNGILDDMIRDQKGESFVLRFLSKQTGDVLPSELSIALKSSAARISAVLNNLEKKGQIMRQIDPINRRNILVSLTEGGRERVETEKSKWERTLAQVFLEMGEERTAKYLQLSDEFFDLMKKKLQDFDKE